MLGDSSTSREPQPDSGTGGSTTQWLMELGPYVLMIGIGMVLYHYANQIAYTPVPGQMGPDRWPKIVIGLFIAICTFETVRRAVMMAKNGGSSRLAASDADEGFSQHMEAHPSLVVAAAAVTVAYLLLFDFLGFFTATIFYVGCVMWIGGVHRPLLVALLSVAMSFAFSFFFLKLIYVALPLGEGPFAQVSLLVMKLVGVN